MMRRAMQRAAVLTLALALGACGDDADGTGDMGPRVDLGPSDLGGSDGGGSDGGGSTVFGENANQTCADGIDNDDDGFLDCLDRGCELRWVCAFEANNVDCADGIDNDGDGATDCDDEQCQGDGIVVCDGPGVAATPADIPAAIAARCSDGVANVNSFVDCFDFSCQHFHAPCFEPPEVVRESNNALCADGLDTDGDGDVDCADSDCRAEAIVVCDAEGNPVSLTPEEIAAQANARCMNGESDDGNRFVDCEDFSCSRNEPLVTVCDEDLPEGDDATCMDGMDNDEDGFVDCEDFDCSMNEDVSVCDGTLENTDLACSNGEDDDGNGFTDCDDNNCPDDGPACRGADDEDA